MKPLKLASTISTPILEDYNSTTEFAKRVKKRESANIVEGYTLTTDFEMLQTHKFYSEINVDNDRLWDVFKDLVLKFPDEVALIYHHVDDEPTYGKYLDKDEL